MEIEDDFTGRPEDLSAPFMVDADLDRKVGVDTVDMLKLWMNIEVISKLFKMNSKLSKFHMIGMYFGIDQPLHQSAITCV